MSTAVRETSGRGALRQKAPNPLADPANRKRVAIVAALVGLAVLVVSVVAGGGGGYVVHTQLTNAGGLRAGFKVRIDGVPVGSITKVDLGAGDVAVADATIDKSAEPLGRDATATVRAVNILGEKYLDINPGNRNDPARSGMVIPESHSGTSVELDDVLDTLDVPTQAALNVILDEGGRGLSGGPGHDLAATLRAMPSSLDRARALLSQLGADNAALGRLVEQGDRVVGAVAGERAALGRTVSGAAGTFGALASRSPQLEATVRAAPGALAALRRALTALQDAAIPLRPAARGLRATAPGLTATLRALPGTARAAAPALRAARAVAPALDRLGIRGTPVARRLAPLARQLETWATGVEPGTGALDASWSDMLGVVEAWARSTAGRDGAGHVFRLAVGAGADLLQQLAIANAPPARHAARRQVVPVKPVQKVLDKVTKSVPPVGGVVHKLIPGVTVPLPPVKVPGPAGDPVNELLDYLLK